MLQGLSDTLGFDIKLVRGLSFFHFQRKSGIWISLEKVLVTMIEQTFSPVVVITPFDFELLKEDSHTI